MIRRRSFIGALVGGSVAMALDTERNQCRLSAAPLPTRVRIADVDNGEDVFSYIRRLKGSFDDTLYKQILGAANEFKEGELIVISIPITL